MIKKVMCVVCLCLSMITAAHAKECDFITYDWLISTAKTTSYTDHIPHFRRLFNSMKVRTFIECGCGYSTKYFMDHSNKVISIEFMTTGTGDIWFKECIKLYKDCTNWLPLAYYASDTFSKACGYQNSIHKDYALIDPRYLNELNEYFKVYLRAAELENNDVDVAFVDPGIYIRGDMVKLFLYHKVPVVVAHDTASDVGSDVDVGLYGWFKVKTPYDYEKIYIPFGQGTTFWINKSFPEVIQSMKRYRDRIIALSEQGGLLYENLKAIADEP